MKNFEITSEGIVIIQWLRNKDPQLGEELYNFVKHKEGEKENYFVEYHKVNTKEEFITVLQELIEKTKEGTVKPHTGVRPEYVSFLLNSS